MSAAYTNYAAGEFEGFGRDLGVALALTFIGHCEEKCDPSHQAMSSMIEEQLYPTGIQGDDNSVYLAYLNTIYEQRSDAEERAQHPESPDDLVATYPWV